MKVAIFFATLLTMNYAFASMLGCADTVSISVAQELSNNPKTNEVVESVTLEKAYEQVSIYKVTSAAPANQIGIPARSEWIVVTTVGPQATCFVQTVLQDSHVE